MKKITEKYKRSSLNEGRNYGLGFAVLKPVNKTKTKFETENAFTACRDYLNDFSYVEYTKKGIGTVYGYNHKLKNCFDKKRLFYIGVNTLDYKNGGSWLPKKEAEKLLISNCNILQKFINKIEEKLQLTNRTSITVDEDTLIFKAPIYWSKTTALISAYTLMIRCYFNVSDFTNETFEKVLRDHKTFISDDNYYKNNIIKLYDNPQIKYDVIDYENLNIKNPTEIHNFGIAGFFMKKQI